MPLDIEELEPITRNDYRRANGAPMVVIDGKNDRYSRPSSFADPLDDKNALVNWKIDRGCIGVAHDRALQARWIALNPDDKDSNDDKKELREHSINAGRGAEKADIGTALHKMSVRWEQGEAGFFPPEPFVTSLIAYSAELQRLNLASIRYEFHTVNREYRCAGTADRLFEACSPLVTPDGSVLPVGTLIVGDLKTGEKLEYSKPAYAVQCALYAAGEFYDVLTDEFIATPPINQDWAIIVHMPADEPGVCEFLWIDLEIGRWGCYLVQQIKLWRKNWRSGEFPMPPVQLDTNLITAFEQAVATDGGYDEGEPNDPFPATTCFCGQPDDPAVVHQDNAPCYVLIDVAPLDAWIEWVRLRTKYVGENDKARARLMALWPDDLPVPKNMINMAQVDRAIPILNIVEADFGLGFVEQPTALQSTGPRQKGT